MLGDVSESTGGFRNRFAALGEKFMGGRFRYGLRKAPESTFLHVKECFAIATNHKNRCEISGIRHNKG